MNEENSRLKIFIESKENNIKQFCLINDIHYNSFHHVLSGKRNIGLKLLKKLLLAYPELNINWVLTGFGKMENTIENSNKNPISEYVSALLQTEKVLKDIENIVISMQKK